MVSIQFNSIEAQLVLFSTFNVHPHTQPPNQTGEVDTRPWNSKKDTIFNYELVWVEYFKDYLWTDSRQILDYVKTSSRNLTAILKFLQNCS